MWKSLILLPLTALLVAPPLRLKADEAAHEIIVKAIDAQGGKEKLSRLLSCHGRSKGTAYLDGKPCPIEAEFWFQLPGQMKLVTGITQEGEKSGYVRVVNGAKVWLRSGDMTRECQGPLLENALGSAYETHVSMLAPLLDPKQFTLEATGEVKIAGRLAVGVRVESKGKPNVSLYFDKESGLLVKSESAGVWPDNERMNIEVSYSDYKDMGGAKIHTRRVDTVDGVKTLEVVTTEMHPLDRIDPDLFAKP